MTKKKTTIITSETQEVIVIRRPVSQTKRTWCAVCSADVEMLRPEEAAAIADVSTSTIYARLDAGQIHHTESGDVLICPGGLFR